MTQAVGITRLIAYSPKNYVPFSPLVSECAMGIIAQFRPTHFPSRPTHFPSRRVFPGVFVDKP